MFRFRIRIVDSSSASVISSSGVLPIHSVKTCKPKVTISGNWFRNDSNIILRGFVFRIGLTWLN